MTESDPSDGPKNPALGRRAPWGFIGIFVILFLGISIAFFALGAPQHPMAGSWLATDDTIFTFRNDGTFVGKDCHGILIWGNWTKLDKARIGFQSLRHKSFYKPQFAVITPEGMQYAVSDGDRFIRAVRISDSEAARGIETAAPLPAP